MAVENSYQDIIKIGDYVVIQKQNYSKLHKMSLKGTVMLGKDTLDLSTIIGNPLPSSYKMESKSRKGNYMLTECQNAISLSEELLKDTLSGHDNRDIFDDGTSQQLSKEEIVELKDKGLSGQHIVEQLLENSKTFNKKTGYAQEKYLKKKEKKYCEYVTIRRPNVRLVAEILYRQDPSKILGVRIDTLSQMLTAIGVQSKGNWIIYESGCQGLIAAAILNAVGDEGVVINTHPGTIFQKNALNALNFTDNQLNNLLTVNINGLLQRLKQNDEKIDENLEMNKESNTSSLLPRDVQMDEVSLKRKLPEENDDKTIIRKKPRWQIEIEKAVEILKNTKMDGLLVVSKEKPNNIVNALIPFVELSRPICVYCQCREPLIDLYFELKSLGNVISLHLTESWLRSHQILPGRTHPDILMTGTGGYLLSGIIVEPKK